MREEDRRPSVALRMTGDIILVCERPTSHSSSLVSFTRYPGTRLCPRCDGDEATIH